MRARHHLRVEVKLSGEAWIGPDDSIFGQRFSVPDQIALAHELLYSSLDKESGIVTNPQKLRRFS